MNYIQYIQGQQNIFLVDMTREMTRPFSELMTKGIKKFLKQGKKVLVINNKKGRSSGLMCHDCGHIPQCSNCSIAVARHANEHKELFGICHICKAHYNRKPHCEECESENIDMYGVGNQQLSFMMKELFGVAPLLIQSEVANSVNKYKKLQTQMDAGVQLILGTSLLSNPMNTRKPDMLCVIAADMGLHSPHFNASYSNFMFLHESIQKNPQAEIILQSYNIEKHSIKHACAGNIEAMNTAELAIRKEGGYPPYQDMCMILYKHEIEKSLYTTTHKLYQELLFLRDSYEFTDLEIYATPPSVYKMYGKYRYHIILKGKNLRQYMEIVYSKLTIHKRGFKIDWDPSRL